MNERFNLKKYAENMSSFHQILITAGLIIVSLVSAWHYTKDSIIDGERESLKSSLKESVVELNLVTDSTLDKKLNELKKVQSDVFISMLDLHYRQLLKLDTTDAKIKEMQFLIKRNHRDIVKLNSMMLAVGDDIGGNTKKLILLSDANSYTDSLEIELSRAKLKTEISNMMNLMKRQHTETIYKIESLTSPKSTRGINPKKLRGVIR